MRYLFISFLFISFQSFSQRGIGPSYATVIDYQKHKGDIILNTKQQIEGNFQYAGGNLKSFSENGKLIKRYKIKDIKKVVLSGSDTTITNKDSTYFKVLGMHKRFYRQLTFGSVKVYDNLFNVNEKKDAVGYFLYVKHKNKLIELDSENFIKWLKGNYPNKIKWNENITIQDIIRQLNNKM